MTWWGWADWVSVVRALLVVVLVSTWAAVSSAQATSAQEAFERGTRAFETGDTEGALIHMRSAFESLPNFRTAAGLGQVELALSRFRDAAEHLEFSLRRYPATEPPEGKGHIMRGLAEARERVVTVVIEHQVPGVVLHIDGQEVATLPVPHDLFVDPGQHTFTFEKPGYLPQSTTQYVPAGSRHTLRVSLTAKEPEVAPPPVASAGPEPSAAAPVTLITGGVLTLAALGTGVAFHFSAESAEQDASELRTRLRSAGTDCVSGQMAAGCASLSETQQRAADRRAVASASLIGAAAASVVTLSLYSIFVLGEAPGDTPERELSVSVAPGSDVRSGWFGVSGSF